MTKSLLEVHLYPTHNGKMAVIDYKPSVAIDPKPVLPIPIILLDNSGSMGDEVPRLANRILPMMLQSLGYDVNFPVTLITFESTSKIYHTTVAKLRAVRVHAAGGTSLAPGIHNLAAVLLELASRSEKPQAIRLLTVSDGAISDTDQALKAAENLSKWASEYSLRINSQAIRFISSKYANPDTRALCSLLQLNNTTDTATAVDIHSNWSGDKIIPAFLDVFLGSSEQSVLATLTTSSSVLKQTPWQTETVSSIDLNEGVNCFWVSESFSASKLKVSGIDPTEIKVVDHKLSDIHWRKYEALLKDKIDAFINQIKILKVLDTSEARTKINSICTYFEGLDRFIVARQLGEGMSSEIVTNEGSLKRRIARMRAVVEKRSKSVLQKLLEIANDDKVGQLNSAQQAAYLRTVNATKNAKGLAKRALNSLSGLDFDEVARQEVIQMHAHLHELEDVDDSDHERSFFSLETTLGGIRAVCELVDDGFIYEMSCHEILELLNIVGVPCEHPIHEYPDAMTFRVDKIHLGSFISLSDVLVHQVQGGGAPLFTPGSNEAITNAIPVFEDERIARFYRKYAPKLLEFTASIGMRRMIAEVPMTFGYTILAGFWKLVEMTSVNKTELCAKILVNVFNSIQPCIGGYFNHLLPLFESTQVEGMAMNIGGDGIATALVPIIHHLKKSEPKAVYLTNVLPKALRALYSFEVWATIRRMYRHQEQPDKIITALLDKLLEINLDKTRYEVQPPFELEPEIIQFNQSYSANEACLFELCSRFKFLNNICLMGPVFEILCGSGTLAEKIAQIQTDVPERTVKTLASSMNITYGFKDFQLFNVVQALLFETKSTRIDEATGKVLLPDLIDKATGVTMIKEYIRKRHEKQYQVDLKIKSDQENAILTADLVNLLVKTSDIRVYCDTFKNGLSKGNCTVQIANPASPGFTELMDRLLNVSGPEVPLQVAKVWVLLLGCKPANKKKNETVGPAVWNGGNVLGFVELDKFKAVFVHYGKATEWDSAAAEYKARRLYQYRSSSHPNRHGHFNDKPSYWALGYASLSDMKASVSKEEFARYVEAHAGCCGL
ncbi:hypothetical protein BCR33DRAFT_771424 [Rhizoclosmatium globosum]|uniref:VWFA domain-containing protein n=1 Tax=Rhizoclosmatium globosum TaxID=329046 RepID=A0A1Y2BCJ1_9FUNG|nr:hypothetical protein BCR33DRAFT_771424 [Rhizoclosmatium globosum]|eukprot:ORY32426.1 hypothetical protein BCR33DRAFT_771424 [Rhizoclosmatium globosum]